MPRPLDAQASRRILSATVELLLERGYAAVSLDDIAARAGVGKPAVYRRYRGKQELAVAAIGSMLPPSDPPADGSYEERIRTYYFALTGAGAIESYVAAVGEFLSLARTDPELLDAWRATVLHPRRDVMKPLIAEAQAAGVIHADVDLDVFIDSMTGQLLARVWQGRPLDAGWQARTWAHVWRSVAS